MAQWEFSSVRVHMATTRHTFNVLALLLLPVLCFVGLIGNALVCIAISTDRRLHNVTNYFLFSLALADLLVCCIVMPLSIVVEVRHGVWTWNVSMCLLYIYADVFLCSASIVHMSVISLDRFLGISQPLRTRNKSRTMILTKIAIVWFITLIVSCPIAVLAIIDDTNILRNNSCTIFSQHYIIYGSTLTFLIPFCIMAVTYVRTTNLLNKQASILSQRANDKMNGNGLRRTMPHRKLGYVRTNSATANGFTNGGMHKTSGNSIRAKASFVSHSKSYQSPTDVDVTKLIANNNNSSIRSNGHKSLTKTSTINKWKSRTSNYLTSIAQKVSRRNSIQAASQELANEHKATRVLAVVFICFFICWTPFFVANFIMGFCGEACSLPPWLGSLFLWLGYISSTINPIIYTVFNKRFRQAFVRILRCQCFHNIRDTNTMYSRNYTTMVPDTYTWSNHERVISMTGKEDNNIQNRTANGSIKWQRQSSGESEQSERNETLSHSRPTSVTPLRDSSRATTEETSDDEPMMSEQRPLITQRVFTSPSSQMKKSLTGLLSPSTSSPFTKSISCVDCQRCSAMVESCSDTDTMTSSINSCPRHFTLFSSAFGGKQVKETFL